MVYKPGDSIWSLSPTHEWVEAEFVCYGHVKKVCRVRILSHGHVLVRDVKKEVRCRELPHGDLLALVRNGKF